jgi:hypothetical protein
MKLTVPLPLIVGVTRTQFAVVDEDVASLDPQFWLPMIPPADQLMPFAELSTVTAHVGDPVTVQLSV